jgi:hypothetical protein
MFDNDVTFPTGPTPADPTPAPATAKKVDPAKLQKEITLAMHMLAGIVKVTKNQTAADLVAFVEPLVETPELSEFVAELMNGGLSVTEMKAALVKAKAELGL